MHCHNISTTRFKKQSLNDLKRGVDCSVRLLIMYRESLRQEKKTLKKILC